MTRVLINCFSDAVVTCLLDKIRRARGARPFLLPSIRARSREEEFTSGVLTWSVDRDRVTYREHSSPRHPIFCNKSQNSLARKIRNKRGLSCPSPLPPRRVTSLLVKRGANFNQKPADAVVLAQFGTTARYVLFVSCPVLSATERTTSATARYISEQKRNCSKTEISFVLIRRRKFQKVPPETRRRRRRRRVSKSESRIVALPEKKKKKILPARREENLATREGEGERQREEKTNISTTYTSFARL